MRGGGGLAVGTVIAATFSLMLAEAATLAPAARLAPLAVGIPALIFVGAQMAIDASAWISRNRRDGAAAPTPEGDRGRAHRSGRFLALLGWFCGLVVLSILLGLVIAFPLFVFSFLWSNRKDRPGLATLIAAAFSAVVYGVFDRLMGLTVWRGLLAPLIAS